MSTITFIGGPFDGDQQEIDAGIPEHFESGCVRAHFLRWVVYLPDGRGNVVFHSYAATLDEGMARLSKEHRNG